MKFPAYYMLVVGLLMLAQWSYFLLAGQVPELKTAPVQTALHLAAELATAVVLMVAGAGLLRQASWARRLALVALGMLIYTLIQSPGYFAQQQIWALVGMFALLLILALVSLVRLFRLRYS